MKSAETIQRKREIRDGEPITCIVRIIRETPLHWKEGIERSVQYYRVEFSSTKEMREKLLPFIDPKAKYDMPPSLQKVTLISSSFF